MLVMCPHTLTPSHLHRVLVHLHVPDGGQLIHGEFGSQELHNGLKLVTVLGLVKVSCVECVSHGDHIISS